MKKNCCVSQFFQWCKKLTVLYPKIPQFRVLEPLRSLDVLRWQELQFRGLEPLQCLDVLQCKNPRAFDAGSFAPTTNHGIDEIYIIVTNNITSTVHNVTNMSR